MNDSWTEENLDVLQNLEFSVIQVWRENPEMTDYAALRAYEAAFHWYRAEARGHTPKPTELTGLDAAAFTAVKRICEFRLGRADLPEAVGKKILPIKVESMVDCLRELSRSVERHTRADGRQGYLTFVASFLS